MNSELWTHLQLFCLECLFSYVKTYIPASSTATGYATIHFLIITDATSLSRWNSRSVDWDSVSCVQCDLYLHGGRSSNVMIHVAWMRSGQTSTDSSDDLVVTMKVIASKGLHDTSTAWYLIFEFQYLSRTLNGFRLLLIKRLHGCYILKNSSRIYTWEKGKT